jgi:hypothetical protein
MAAVHGQQKYVNEKVAFEALAASIDAHLKASHQKLRSFSSPAKGGIPARVTG